MTYEHEQEIANNPDTEYIPYHYKHWWRVLDSGQLDDKRRTATFVYTCRNEGCPWRKTVTVSYPELRPIGAPRYDSSEPEHAEETDERVTSPHLIALEKAWREMLNNYNQALRRQRAQHSRDVPKGERP